MKIEKLIHMANQIAGFFATQPISAEDKAVQIANHLSDFWDPRMRRALHDYLAQGGAGLDPLACTAMSQLRRPASGSEDRAPDGY